MGPWGFLDRLSTPVRRGRALALHRLTLDAHRAASGPCRMDFEGWGVLGPPSRPVRLERQGAEVQRHDPLSRRSGVLYLHWLGFGLDWEDAGGPGFPDRSAIPERLERLSGKAEQVSAVQCLALYVHRADLGSGSFRGRPSTPARQELHSLGAELEGRDPVVRPPAARLALYLRRADFGPQETTPGCSAVLSPGPGRARRDLLTSSPAVQRLAPAPERRKFPSRQEESLLHLPLASQRLALSLRPELRLCSKCPVRPADLGNPGEAANLGQQAHRRCPSVASWLETVSADVERNSQCGCARRH